MEGMDYNRQANIEDYSATDMPKYPARTLAIHVLVKGLQLGSVAGLFIATPLYAMAGKRSIGTAWRRMLPISTMLGGLASSGMLYNKQLKGELDVAGVDDRAYRIAHNAGQLKVDRYSVVGSLTAMTGAVLGGGFGPFTLAAAACTGVAFSVVVFALERMGLSKMNRVTKGKPLATDEGETAKE